MLLTKPMSMWYKGKQNIREHIMKMSNLIIRLKALKLEMSESVLVNLFLISLLVQFIFLRLTTIFKRRSVH